MQDVDAPPLSQARHIRELVAQAGRDQEPPRGHCLVADLDREAIAVPAQRGDPSGLDVAAVAGYLRAAGRVNVRRRRAVAGEEVVHVAGRGVARLARVHHQHRAAGPGQRDRAGQPGRATADHHDVIGPVHAPTMRRGQHI